MNDSRVHLHISGMVQGVGYRFYAARKAAVYGLKGFVKNLVDGRVEVIAEGDRGLVEEFIKDLKRGPISAHVTDVRIEWEKPTFEFDGFHTL
ncbi:MAG: acylphosphatase [Bacteroidetes bacterium]|nr:acylphosphatase [Bacteroidota bacterium]MCL5268570.1 acylphosphatase [Bacteroidota bacterium]